MVRRAFIQELGSGRMEPEMAALCLGFQSLGIPIELFTAKRIERRELPLERETLVAGDVPSVLGALAQLGIEPPPTNDSPRCLEPFLHRNQWPSTVRQLTARIRYENAPPVFAKPVGRKKRFTGHVFRNEEDLALFLRRASLNTPILCSDVVRWRSEYRVFVIRGRIVGIHLYEGDETVRVDTARVEEAVRLLEEAGEDTSAYGVDFGVLDTGQTALVEWNDGFSLGAYGLEDALYTELTLTRWVELTTTTT